MDTTVLTVVVAITSGFFAIMKQMVDKNFKQQEKSQQVFLDHLEKKNGYNERICDKFDKSIQGFQAVMNDSTNTLKKAVEQHTVILESLSDVEVCIREIKK